MKRMLTLDLARGFTVLIMPSVHTIMLYSKPYVEHCVLGHILGFLAEGPGAQLFMFLMGMSFIFSSYISKRYVLQRAFYFLLAAYTLNFLKFIVPLFLGWLPEDLLKELQLTNRYSAASFFMLMGDILHFAAMAYPILFLIFRLPYYQLWSLVFAFAILLLSPFVWDVKTDLVFVDYLLKLAGGGPPAVYFPLFPWLVYPLLGFAAGYYLKQQGSQFFIQIVCIGCLLILTGYIIKQNDVRETVTFYRTYPGDTLIHAGIVFITLYIWHLLHTYVRTNYFFKLLIWCSRHITIIYFVQWIFIFWMLPVFGYKQLDLSSSVFCIGFTTIIALLITASVLIVKRRFFN